MFLLQVQMRDAAKVAPSVWKLSRSSLTQLKRLTVGGWKINTSRLTDRRAADVPGVADKVVR